MFSFLISVAALLLGYLFYSRVIERIICPDSKAITPALKINDGVDYLPLPGWKIFMIQFLNIAGTGPIFGAIMGAKFGPASYLWIVLGSIFAGAVYDYINGMASLYYDGASLPDMIGRFMNRRIRNLVLVITLVLLVMVGAVFVYSPALILRDLADVFHNPESSMMFWILIIFAYYLLATLLPVDKIIGRIYPVFAVSLMFMAVALMVGLVVKWPHIPEFWDGLYNRGPEVGLKGQEIFPCLFITVACGAISGFHATQSPMMARCMTNARQGRPIFYGAMITEGLVALIWAAVSSYFFFDGGMQEVGANGAQAPEVVVSVSRSWLGMVGGILAILGVVAAPITTGDTAFRSGRLILADIFHVGQKSLHSRILMSLPLFAVAILLLWYNIADENGFNHIWSYFGWANQTLACVILWLLSIWLFRHSNLLKVMVTLLPAAFMTGVCVSFICVSNLGLGLPYVITPYVACGSAVAGLVLFINWARKHEEDTWKFGE